MATPEAGVRLALARAQVARAQQELARRRGLRDGLQQTRDERAAQLAQAGEAITVGEQVSLLFRQASDYAREQARQAVERQVTQALRYIFGSDDMEFRIIFPEVRGKPEADFYVASTLGDARVEIEPEEGRGGGVVDVVSLALRLALLETYRPKLDGPLVLDEPAKHVSDEYIQAVAEFLSEVAAHYGRQVIMVTHNSHLAGTAAVAYHVRLKDGRSQVERAGSQAP